MNMEIRSLSGLPFELLYRAFQEAFADYELQLSNVELERMLKRRGFSAELSIGAFLDDELVAFTFNGTGTFQGISTAYDTGTGTIKTQRGKGLAKEIFRHSLPFLREAGIQQYLLEVLQHNEKAVGLYRKLGFKITREFSYHVQKKDAIQLPNRNLEDGYELQPASVGSILKNAHFDELFASWQNSRESILRAESDFLAAGAYLGEKLTGYCIFEPRSGDLTRLSVDPAHRRKGIATKLLSLVLQKTEHENIKVINVPLDAQDFLAFLSRCNIAVTGKQYEMGRGI